MSKKKAKRPLSKAERNIIKKGFANMETRIEAINEEIQQRKAPPPQLEKVHVNGIISPVKQARLVQAYLDLTDENLRPISTIKNSIFEILFTLTQHSDIMCDDGIQTALFDLYQYHAFLGKMEEAA